jgi:mannose-1-phosphate guanylyltransferase
MVLAAGHGVRLAPLTEEKAKPACPALNRPIIHFPLRQVGALRPDRVVVNLHHLPETVAAALEPPPFGLAVRTIYEPAILGTGGGLKNARALLDGAETIVLLNGDTIAETELSALVAEHRRTGALATMLLLDDPRVARYGAVEVAPDGAVTDIAGLLARPGVRRGLFAGAHILSPEIFAVMPPDAAICIIRQVYLPLIAGRRGAVRAAFGAGRFFDLGAPADYLEAQWALLDDAGPFAFVRDGLQEIAPGVWSDPTADLSPLAVIRPPALIGHAAVVDAGASIGPYAVIGARARVSAGPPIDHTVIWEEAIARGPLSHAIVTPRATVAV